jgi:hypothetical protein
MIPITMKAAASRVPQAELLEADVRLGANTGRAPQRNARLLDYAQPIVLRAP